MNKSKVLEDYVNRKVVSNDLSILLCFDPSPCVQVDLPGKQSTGYG